MKYNINGPMVNKASEQHINIKTQGTPQAQARKWLTDLYAGNCDPKKREEFVLWIQNNEANRHAFRHSLNVWQTIGMTDSVVDWLEQCACQDVLVPLTTKPKRNLAKSVMWLSSIAASIVLIVVSGVFHNPDKLDLTTPNIAFNSPIGQNLTIILSDGSNVTLAGNSSILVNISQHARRITLQKGGAYFDVSHDPSRMFSVTAEQLQVRVRGTAFEVKRSTNNAIKISVQRGLVEVAELPAQVAIDDQVTTDEQIVIDEQSAKDEQVLQLRANEQVRADNDGTFITKVTRFDSETEFAWLKGRLIYDDIPLKTVLIDINRYAKKPVVILDESINDLAITASFTFDQIDQVLAGLASAYPIILTEENDRKVLTKK
jgi:transmembrane sensor